MVEPTPSHWQKWSSYDFQPRERFDAWQEALNQSHLPWALNSAPKPNFSGGIEMGRLQDLQVIRCACQPCSGFRGSEEIATSRNAYYGLLLLFEGYEEISIGSHSVFLEPGNTLLWDSTMPMQFKLHSPIKKITVLMPQSKLHDVFPKTPFIVGKAIDWRRGLGAVTTSHISTLISQTSYIQAQQTRPAADITLELIATSLGLQQYETNVANKVELLANIKQYIENNLEDPELRPQTLANQFSISVRYLHLLFSEEEATVSRWILTRRLERCRCELVAAGSQKSITKVAFRWGFNDAAHFSRVFKMQYGFPPREYRRRNTN